MKPTRVGSFDDEMYDKMVYDYLERHETEPTEMIYENDMPSEEDALLYDIFGSYSGNLNTRPRFKPNGITDNVKKYKGKSAYNYIIKLAEEKEIADSHDITKSNFGFK